MDARPPPKMALRMPDVGLRQVEAESRQSRPSLLDGIKEAAGATADVNNPQFALISSGKNFRERRQALPSHGVGHALEEHLDLRVVAIGGFFGQPAAGLEVEILQVVVRTQAARFCIQNLVCTCPPPPRVDLGKIADESPRAVQYGKY